MQVKSIAFCNTYFRSTLSYHLSLRPLFCRFLIGRLRSVLLYNILQEQSQNLHTKVVWNERQPRGLEYIFLAKSSALILLLLKHT